MITIKNHKNIVLGTGDTEAHGEIDTKTTCVIYINYTKGDEDGLSVTFDVYNSYIDDYYPVMYEDSAETVKTICKKITESGNYRLISSVAANESRLRVNISYDNPSSANGTTLAYISPISPIL